MRICIDLVYLNITGGRLIADLLIENLTRNLNYDIDFVTDKRLNYIINVDLSSRFNFYDIRASEIERFKFYSKRNYNRIICFGNVPPPIVRNKGSLISVYLHNSLLFEKNTFIFGYDLKSAIVFKMKLLYVRLLTTKNVDFICQTKHMKFKINKIFRDKDITIAPFYSSRTGASVKREIGFFYPSMTAPHKNHLRLLKAWEIAERYTKKTPLYLTIPDDDLALLSIINDLRNHGFIIFNLGLICYSQTLEYYSLLSHVIYPSLAESFGLVLIESVLHENIILTSNLDYSNEIIESDIVFDPFSTDSISSAIINSLSIKTSNARIKVKSSFSPIISLIDE